MNKIKFASVLVLTALLAACSKGPSESEVEGLIQEQYDKVDSMMGTAMAGSGDSEMASAMGEMMAGMMPKLEKVENVECDETDGENAYLCTADLTQTISGETRTDNVNFEVHQVNDKWVLRQ